MVRDVNMVWNKWYAVGKKYHFYIQGNDVKPEHSIRESS